MDPLLIGVIIIVVLLVPIALGVPVGIAMFVVSMGGMGLLVGAPFLLTTAQTLPYAVASDFAFVVVPMFILMGTLTAATGVTTELYTAAYRWTSGLRGGLYFATTLAAGGFGAINGSTVVSSALFTRIALPEMIRFKYSVPVSAGCICAAGTFAALIPPSLAMVIYALLTGQSVGALLMAGLIPGLLTVGIYFVGLKLFIAAKPEIAPHEIKKYTFIEKLSSLKGLWAILLLIAVVMGGIYSGVMFPSTAGAAGAGGALLIGLVRGRLTGKGLWESLKETVVMTSVLFLIIIGGLCLSRLLLVSGSIGAISAYVNSSDLPVWGFLFAAVLIYVILGMFVDGISMLVMTVPFLYPVANELGLDPIWFGVVVVKLIEIGAITPPVGLNLFAVISASDGAVDARKIFRGILPFILMELVTLGLIIWFPQISLWLPTQMYS
ncbi:TRAP transporter large permease [Sneathiella sp. HT1-7]|uniref:TRAP transporter large permease n=1 Tax=Sneathiella sp. HT1-7 TaxID=2887192 RepID=UPI001D1427BE|nr:TRAP transporter large permease [Sneathiella sp. HT1-7]MCC3306200.1 TRAP transporter large permease [Sneathiella sp. HT1-7]